MSDSRYCPLCGAHESEQGEGEATDAEVLLWRGGIINLHGRLLAMQLQGKMVDHIDGNPNNNTPSNLRVVTMMENR